MGIENPRVGGSIPSLATMYNNGLQRCRPFLFVALVYRAVRSM